MTQTLRDKAALFSRAAHSAVGQRRKYTGEPYWRHPEEVARIIANTVRPDRVTDEMLAAAYLHDTVEDTQVTQEDITREFGAMVSGYVYELTDQFSSPEIGNRAHRKALERDRLARIHPDSQTIKYADLIDNTRSIVARDPDFARVYLEEKRELLLVMVNGDQRLWRMAWAIMRKGMMEVGS